MENRILIIGDEILGEQGEAANRAAEIILCREANRPIQFSINAPSPLSLSQFMGRASSDIIGKKAGRMVMALGIRELKKDGGEGSVVADSYKKLVELLSKKIQGSLFFLTIPTDMFPQARYQVEYLNDVIRHFEELDAQRIKIWDLDLQVNAYKKKQEERGKFARSLFNEDGLPTSLGNTFTALYLQDCILKEIK